MISSNSHSDGARVARTQSAEPAAVAAAKLQQEATRIAAVSASHYMKYLSGLDDEFGRSFNAYSSGQADAAGSSFGRDQSRSILREGFVRLTEVVSLALLVDEPGLIADDLLWLQRMLAAREINISFPGSTDLLFDSFLTGCSDFLSHDETAQLSAVLDQAASIVVDHSRAG